MIAFLWNWMRLEVTVWFIGQAVLCTIIAFPGAGRGTRR